LIYQNNGEGFYSPQISSRILLSAIYNSKLNVGEVGNFCCVKKLKLYEKQ